MLTIITPALRPDDTFAAPRVAPAMGRTALGRRAA